jgi:hypothetical protein
MSSHCEKRKSGGTPGAGPGSGKQVANSGAGTGRLGGVSYANVKKTWHSDIGEGERYPYFHHKQFP